MRARSGEPPRTMVQKILAPRADDPTLAGESVEVKVDQVAVTRSLEPYLREAGLGASQRARVEVAVLHAGVAVTGKAAGVDPDPTSITRARAVGVSVARPGAGFAGPVHLERFASPARLCVSDSPRLSLTGGAGMLSVLATPRQIGQALARGTCTLRTPRSVHVLLSGRLRPFVGPRDVVLELCRRGLGDLVRDVGERVGAPIVLEVGGPSARLLSVGERAIIATVCSRIGALAVLFGGDERTEVFLRDQRRSKAHRSLAPDPGARYEEAVTVDLGAIDPLAVDEAGAIRPVRDLAGRPVSQVVLGGDGVTLRDMMTASTLLKAKKVPSGVEWLVAVPSRQMLEVLAADGALAELVATGARIIEPDERVLSGALYPPTSEGASVRTFDADPRDAGAVRASVEAAAFAVAHGKIGDPRAFKRPTRVTVPRELPTEDVLIVRDRDPATAHRRPAREASRISRE